MVSWMPLVPRASGPYESHVQTAGAPPIPIPDLPVTAVFLAIFLSFGIAHQIVFLRNKRHGRLFVFSGAMFGFCAIRVIACILRIIWAYNDHNVNLAIAAQVFVFAGTLILFIVNFFLCQRLMRARHPSVGWSKLFSILFPPVTVAITVIFLLMIIAVTIHSSFTLNPAAQRIDHKILEAGLVVFAVAAASPLVMTLTAITIRPDTYLDKFGAGSFRTKVLILLFSSSLLTIGATFRAVSAFLKPIPLGAPRPWYLSRGAFYGFNFSIEAVIVVMYLVIRVDRRFLVPNNASGPTSYSMEILTAEGEKWRSEALRSTNSVYASQSISSKHPHTMSLSQLSHVSRMSRLSNAASMSLADLESPDAARSVLSIDPRTGKYVMSQPAINYSDPAYETYAGPHVYGHGYVDSLNTRRSNPHTLESSRSIRSTISFAPSGRPRSDIPPSGLRRRSDASSQIPQARAADAINVADQYAL